MRQFIRHPIDVPVEISIGPNGHGGHGGHAGDARGGMPSGFHTHDISAGGLAFHSDHPAEPGMPVEISIGWMQPPFHVQARVAWCHRHEIDGYELGVTFLDAEDAFRARMVEQLCHIEDYRRSQQRSLGRELSVEEAAAEWIERYAAEFPEIGAGTMH